MKKVGFLPIIPHSVTNYCEYYISNKKFRRYKEAAKSAEFSFHIRFRCVPVVMDVALSQPSEFLNFLPIMSIFHMTKMALHYAEKYFKGSGIDIALVLGKCFGSKTIESVLSGGPYLRSLFGMQIMKKGFKILK